MGQSTWGFPRLNFTMKTSPLILTCLSSVLIQGKIIPAVREPKNDTRLYCYEGKNQEGMELESMGDTPTLYQTDLDNALSSCCATGIWMLYTDEFFATSTWVIYGDNYCTNMPDWFD